MLSSEYNFVCLRIHSTVDSDFTRRLASQRHRGGLLSYLQVTLPRTADGALRVRVWEAGLDSSAPLDVWRACAAAVQATAPSSYPPSARGV